MISWACLITDDYEDDDDEEEQGSAAGAKKSLSSAKQTVSNLAERASGAAGVSVQLPSNRFWSALLPVALHSAANAGAVLDMRAAFMWQAPLPWKAKI